MLRQETNKDYWILFPSECREWMEIPWYVMVRYNVYIFDQNFRIKTTRGEYEGPRFSGGETVGYLPLDDIWYSESRLTKLIKYGRSKRLGNRHLASLLTGRSPIEKEIIQTSGM